MGSLKVEHGSYVDSELDAKILVESVSGFYCIGCGCPVTLKRTTQFWDGNKVPQPPSGDLYYDCKCGASFAVRLEMQFIIATVQIENREIVEVNTVN